AAARRSFSQIAAAAAIESARIGPGAIARPRRSARYEVMTAAAHHPTSDAAAASMPMSGMTWMSLSFGSRIAMFVGHFGLAFGAKRVARPVSLGTLFIACQLADLLWPTLLLLGYERVEVQPGATAVTPLNFVSY